MAANREVCELRSTSQETYRRLKLFSPRGRRAAVGPLLPRGRQPSPRSCSSEGFLRAAQTATPEVRAEPDVQSPMSSQRSNSMRRLSGLGVILASGLIAACGSSSSPPLSSMAALVPRAEVAKLARPEARRGRAAAGLADSRWVAPVATLPPVRVVSLRAEPAVSRWAARVASLQAAPAVSRWAARVATLQREPVASLRAAPVVSRWVGLAATLQAVRAASPRAAPEDSPWVEQPGRASTRRRTLLLSPSPTRRSVQSRSTPHLTQSVSKLRPGDRMADRWSFRQPELA